MSDVLKFPSPNVVPNVSNIKNVFFFPQGVLRIFMNFTVVWTPVAYYSMKPLFIAHIFL